MENIRTQVSSELVIGVTEAAVFMIVAWTYAIANNTGKGTRKRVEHTS